ncbi:phosphoenolpyruvate--protein phosphotransferase [Anoxybacterium hadale]|uniref:Phosphoenolpyruvate--protein phosphotransferase n=1 Tax=Anoxybacterium hadale TaxID=3408580 RepID=A0ACD1ABQ1_9FIRM|nr:phosphoenolpyruvate--protein phosphotransferase [Clostridiales bacterium]
MVGIGVVPGMAKAKTYLLDEDTVLIEKRIVDDPETEYQRFLAAKEVCGAQLEEIMGAMPEHMAADNREIFDYQLLLLEDTGFLGLIQTAVQKEQVNCEYAVHIAAQKYIALFENMDNDYLKQRTIDMVDISRRLNAILTGKEQKTLTGILEDSIVAAADLTPSQTAGINRDRVKGILLEKGGSSSHSVIIARAMDIPCIVGIEGLLDQAIHGEMVIMNGSTGEVITNPTQAQTAEYEAYTAKEKIEKQQLDRYKKCATQTLDGTKMQVYANITSENDVTALLENGGEGVGLFRTEFLYMAGESLPTEELQYKVYSNIAKRLEGRPLIIRTLDAGGDKNIGSLGIEKEENPFLGYRAIRYCLDHPELFKTQISAILRAGAGGNTSFMVPMIATIDEVLRTRALAEEVKAELEKKGIPHAGAIHIGMMVETPAAAFDADRFAREVDFFSIGTNDLTQYLFAADRMNQRVTGLNSYFQPTLLRAIKHICECGKRNGIEVDICGQAGEIPALIPLWVAMGVDNLSVSIPAIPKVRKIICETRSSDAAEIMKKALLFDSAQELEEFLKQQFSHKEVRR